MKSYLARWHSFLEKACLNKALSKLVFSSTIYIAIIYGIALVYAASNILGVPVVELLKNSATLLTALTLAFTVYQYHKGKEGQADALIYSEIDRLINQIASRSDEMMSNNPDSILKLMEHLSHFSYLVYQCELDYELVQSKQLKDSIVRRVDRLVTTKLFSSMQAIDCPKDVYVEGPEFTVVTNHVSDLILKGKIKSFEAPFATAKFAFDQSLLKNKVDLYAHECHLGLDVVNSIDVLLQSKIISSDVKSQIQNDLKCYCPYIYIIYEKFEKHQQVRAAQQCN
ncbi:hypothetical protein L2750_12880 [Shewanella submarina]|uniref:SMODS and SLOG-associating 2TM effector domain-containing protein n=1 Tax=Shewanella submarina TaxID=2016376 RepID=A0ABV7GHC5_9GAMM|nr:hypothetical protein [Shewanella submarina]MCL1038044.1 hypothetical protein [Shewanella submarina]